MIYILLFISEAKWIYANLKNKNAISQCRILNLNFFHSFCHPSTRGTKIHDVIYSAERPSFQRKKKIVCIQAYLNNEQKKLTDRLHCSEFLRWMNEYIKFLFFSDWSPWFWAVCKPLFFIIKKSCDENRWQWLQSLHVKNINTNLLYQNTLDFVVKHKNPREDWVSILETIGGSLMFVDYFFFRHCQ